VLAGSAIPLCLDTGHLLIGGTDPPDLARAVPQRIAHAHLKDVDAGLAARVQSGELHRGSRRECIGRWGPVTSTSPALSRRCATTGSTAGSCSSRTPILDGEPADEGPIRDVLASVKYLRGVAANSA
jgi:inosose dehydratase